MNPIREEKDRIRDSYLEKRKSMSEEERLRRDAKICEIAQGLVSFRHAEVVLFYAPTRYEIDIMPLVETALARGKQVAFPRCNTENHSMQYHFVTNVDQLAPDAYNIREPAPELPVYDYANDPRTAICFVPGAVYDKGGYRIGYGKGYYDRYLNRFSGCKIGVIYSDFITTRVPRGRYDIAADILLTEKGVKLTSEH